MAMGQSVGGGNMKMSRLQWNVHCLNKTVWTMYSEEEKRVKCRRFYFSTLCLISLDFSGEHYFSNFFLNWLACLFIYLFLIFGGGAGFLWHLEPVLVLALFL